MNGLKPEPGRICLSKMGRDKDRYFIITDIIDESYVMIADGVMRKLSAPKKKKLKHLDLKPIVLESIAEKLVAGTKVFDSEIRSAIMSSAYMKAEDDRRN